MGLGFLCLAIDLIIRLKKIFLLLSPNAPPCSFLPFDSHPALEASFRQQRAAGPPCFPVSGFNIPALPGSPGFLLNTLQPHYPLAQIHYEGNSYPFLSYQQTSG